MEAANRLGLKGQEEDLSSTAEALQAEAKLEGTARTVPYFLAPAWRQSLS